MLKYLFLLPALAAANPSLRTIPPDTWYRAPGTALTTVCPDRAMFPAIQGVGGCAMVTAAWSGGTLDPTGKRLLVWGGGHADYYGNEVYAFDLEALKWSRLTEPSPSPTLSKDPMADGQPVSRHTYDGLAWIGHAGRFFAYGGSMAGIGWGTEVTWTLDPVSKAWRNMAPGGGVRPTTNCCNFTGAYDPESKQVYFRDPYYLYAYSYDANTWTRLMDWSHSWSAGKSVVDTSRKILFTAGSGEFLAYDITSGKDVSAAWRTTGGDAFLQKSGSGLAYDPHGDRLVGWAGDAPWILDLKTRAWSPGNAGGAPASPETNGTYGRWQYLPWDGVFALVNRAGEDVYFYRPPGPPTSLRAPAARALRPGLLFRGRTVNGRR